MNPRRISIMIVYGPNPERAWRRGHLRCCSPCFGIRWGQHFTHTAIIGVTRRLSARPAPGAAWGFHAPGRPCVTMRSPVFLPAATALPACFGIPGLLMNWGYGMAFPAGTRRCKHPGSLWWVCRLRAWPLRGGRAAAVCTAQLHRSDWRIRLTSRAKSVCIKPSTR